MGINHLLIAMILQVPFATVTGKGFPIPNFINDAANNTNLGQFYENMMTGFVVLLPLLTKWAPKINKNGVILIRINSFINGKLFFFSPL